MQNLMPPVDTPDKAFHDGNPLTGELGTIITALFMNSVQAAIRNSQAEIISVLADAGIAIDPNKTDQLLAALKATFATNTNVNGRVPVTRKVNGKALSTDITLTAGDVGALAKDQNGADIQNKPLFRENVGLVKQTSSTDATSGSVMINGAWGWGAPAPDTAAFNAATTSDLVQLLRNSPPGAYRNKLSEQAWWPGLLTRTGDTFMYIRAGHVASSGAANTSGVKVLTGSNSTSGEYDLWTNKNLPNPMTTDTAQTIPGVKTFTNYPRANGYHVRTAEAMPRDVAYLRGLPADQSKVELFANLSSLFLRSPTDTYVSANCGYTGNAWYKTDASKESRVLSVTTGGLTVSSSPAGNPEAIVRTDPILVRGLNAVTDANGFYKTPGSTGDTVSSSDIAGIPLPFPAAVAPTGWLKCNGQSFDKTLYPILASRYPSGVLPDLRGEFVRGWDDGRGADSGRALLSAQSDAIRNITGKFETADLQNYVPSGAFADVTRTGAGISGSFVGVYHTEIDFDASKVVPTANENRPRNIAFNYIVRAA
ncbi:phage tail protein [Pectobacterium odoriferum]|uniref:phage tail protein n=3 Tax=Pectobacterium odoriferum TaxID=78398 RepID=UPI0032EC1A5D